MARQTKRIRKNIQTVQKMEEALEGKPQGRQYKPWENVALLLMYAQRRMTMTPTRETWIRRGIFAAIALALVLFAYAVYLQYLI